MTAPHEPRRPLARVIAVVALVAAIGAVGWLVLTERGGVNVWTLVDDASGLNPGAAVTLSGVDVGEIKRVSLTDDERARIDVRIEREHRHRLRGPVAQDCTDHPDDDGDDEQKCDGLRFDLVWKATRTAVLPTPGLAIRPTAGPVLADGTFVPTVEPPGFSALLAALQDKRVVRELPLALRDVVPPLKRMAKTGSELSEGLQKSPAGKLLGVDDKQQKEPRDNSAKGC